MSRVFSPVAALLLVLLASHSASATNATLRGSRASMLRQNDVARQNDYTFIRTPGQVQALVDEGHLVPIQDNADLEVARGVSFPAARPEMRTFLERLAGQYREACGERLVVTSLTRPLSGQPSNAHALSVHPAGMAADLRISERGACRSWLESTLLSLERRELLDVTRERTPPHYHVAVFPDAYMEHVARLAAADSAREAAVQRTRAEAPAARQPVQTAGVVGAPAPEDRRKGGPAALVTLASLALGLGLLRRDRRASE